MKLFFASRSAARRFAMKNSNYKLADMGAAAANDMLLYLFGDGM